MISAVRPRGDKEETTIFVKMLTARRSWSNGYPREFAYWSDHSGPSFRGAAPGPRRARPDGRARNP